jgi:hypothetical protein
MPPLKAISWPLLLMPTPHWVPEAFRNVMRGRLASTAEASSILIARPMASVLVAGIERWMKRWVEPE